MKKLITVSLLAAAGLMSAGVAQADEALAKAKNCMSCHQIDKKVVGPAYKEVAKKYTAKDEAMLVDKVLKGRNPAELPFQLPSKFWLAVNLKTAKAIGVNVPGTMLTRADEVIE